MKKKKYFEYYITDAGVLSFTPKFVYINGSKTTSFVRLQKFLFRLDPSVYTPMNCCIFGLFSYKDYRDLLYRLVRFNTKYWITTVSSAFVHKASDIYYGQYDSLYREDLVYDLPF